MLLIQSWDGYYWIIPSPAHLYTYLCYICAAVNLFPHQNHLLRVFCNVMTDVPCMLTCLYLYMLLTWRLTKYLQGLASLCVCVQHVQVICRSCSGICIREWGQALQHGNLLRNKCNLSSVSEGRLYNMETC